MQSQVRVPKGTMNSLAAGATNNRKKKSSGSKSLLELSLDADHESTPPIVNIGDSSESKIRGKVDSPTQSDKIDNPNSSDEQNLSDEEGENNFSEPEDEGNRNNDTSIFPEEKIKAIFMSLNKEERKRVS